MSKSTPSPASGDFSAPVDLAVRLLKERGHLAFDEVAELLKSHGYPVSGELSYLYSENTCLMAWLGMSRLFWIVADQLRHHRNVRIERAAHLRPAQYPANLGLPIARDETGPFTEPHWLPCEFVWRANA